MSNASIYKTISKILVVVASLIIALSATLPLLVFRGEIQGYASLVYYRILFHGKEVSVPLADSITVKSMFIVLFTFAASVIAVVFSDTPLLYAVFMNEIVAPTLLINLKKLLVRTLTFTKITLTVGGGKLVLNYTVLTNSLVDFTIFIATVIAVVGLILALYEKFTQQHFQTQ